MQAEFIDGIYNYCDRWCTRCKLTSSCRVFDKERKTSEMGDMKDTDLWREISGNLTEAMVLLEKVSVEHDLDLNKVFDGKELMVKVKADHQSDPSRTHELALLAQQYGQASKTFFDNSKKITDDARELAREVIMGLKTRAQADKKAEEVTRHMETVQWYMYFIGAKIQRALYCLRKSGDDDDDIMNESMIYDSNGSAKVALLAIDQSLAAWKKLYEIMGSAEDVALECLAILTKLKVKSLDHFPGAMEFVRPGFDQEYSVA